MVLLFPFDFGNLPVEIMEGLTTRLLRRERTMFEFAPPVLLQIAEFHP